jgi:hypothetical protein
MEPATDSITVTRSWWIPAMSAATQLARLCYYLAILLGLLLLYGRGDFSTPGFIYQGF